MIGSSFTEFKSAQLKSNFKLVKQHTRILITYCSELAADPWLFMLSSFSHFLLFHFPLRLSTSSQKGNLSLSRPHIFYRFIWIYSDLFDEGFVSKSLSLDMIRSSHVRCHVTYNSFVQWHVTLRESCHSCTDIRDWTHSCMDIHNWTDKPRAQGRDKGHQYYTLYQDLLSTVLYLE